MIQLTPVNKPPKIVDSRRMYAVCDINHTKVLFGKTAGSEEFLPIGYMSRTKGIRLYSVFEDAYNKAAQCADRFKFPCDVFTVTVTVEGSI